MNNLSFDQLSALLDSVFAPAAREGWLTLLVDLPDARVPDHEAWLDRRRIATEWFTQLQANADALPFSAVVLCVYPNVGSNNNDLPAAALVADGMTGYEALAEVAGAAADLAVTGAAADVADAGAAADGAAPPTARRLPFSEILDASSVVLALTELSATAPLKLLAAKHDFRGATLPGFSRAMIPVLPLDYERVHERVVEFKDRLDRADAAAVTLVADDRVCDSTFDLRFRTGHASGGLMRAPHTVGNLPSGEAYIVPYEGEREGEPSRTRGELPVQFGDEIVVYRLERNQAVDVLTTGPRSDQERQRLAEEPAYGNMAEVGIGVLGEWGVQAVGSTLLDEKLGLHIAFGRSDHFGGVTSPTQFRDPANVVHIDRVYVESVQPRIQVREVAFTYADGTREVIIQSGRFVV